jgi:DNA-binding transcriptional LysR family regulator
MDAMIGNLREIDIKRLRIFMTIVECGGFIQAQNELNLSASTISVRMSELEEKHGLRLCHRGRSGFSMTPEGNEVYEACQTLLLAHENFISSVGTAKGIISGELRVGIIDNMIFDPNLPISKALSNFCEQTTSLETARWSLWSMTRIARTRAIC